jgi:hypothetical protein
MEEMEVVEEGQRVGGKIRARGKTKGLKGS